MKFILLLFILNTNAIQTEKIATYPTEDACREAGKKYMEDFEFNLNGAYNQMMLYRSYACVPVPEK